ncbi:class II aldolase/adducin family protein [Variovorax sp. PDNC026]|uniref:class II aldolase/adducin family protein n=1 Tax=Variovorax sp. PDNC026 TaxID=2811425 RepID=UPI001F0658FA|nr:class II aldolase/adducin family protein [Variovorax sp. PDNC026]
MKSLVSPQEWAARVELAACYRLMDLYGMTDMIYNHISARVPGEPGHFLINAYGLHYREITASSLHKIDGNGEIVLRGDSDYGINHAGFVIHSAVHAARADLHCAIHTHTRAGTAVAAMQCGLLPVSLHAMRYAARVGYHDFEGVVTELDERERIARDLGDFDVLVLRNHGLLACGRTIPEAFNTMYGLELACRIQVDAMHANTPLCLPAQAVQERTAAFFERNAKRQFGKMEWEALTRMLDRTDPSYAN